MWSISCLEWVTATVVAKGIEILSPSFDEPSHLNLPSARVGNDGLFFQAIQSPRPSASSSTCFSNASPFPTSADPVRESETSHPADANLRCRESLVGKMLGKSGSYAPCRCCRLSFANKCGSTAFEGVKPNGDFRRLLSSITIEERERIRKHLQTLLPDVRTPTSTERLTCRS
jgi:hypothetical protein